MMASSGKETLDIKTVHQCNRCLGCKTLHPQASIIRLDHTNVEQHSIKFDFYTILLMENDIEDCCYCGRKAYDYSNATMVFLPPEQTFDMHKNRVLPQQGWLLAFHPDLQHGICNGCEFHVHCQSADQFPNPLRIRPGGSGNALNGSHRGPGRHHKTGCGPGLPVWRRFHQHDLPSARRGGGVACHCQN